MPSSLHCLGLGLLALACITLAQASDLVRIPDEKLRGALLAQGVDANRDGQIQVAEAARVEALNLNEIGLADTTGIEACTNLRRLEIESNRLTRIDLGALTKLERLSVRHNELRTLDVSPLKNLRELDARRNQLTALDVRGLPALELLSLTQNEQLVRLELGGHPNLKQLFLSHTQMTAVDLRAYPQMIAFEAFKSPLQTIEFGEKPALETLSLTESQVATIGVSRCPKLRILWANTCFNLRTLNTAGAVSLEEVSLRGSSIVSADFTGSPRLKKIDLGNTRITELNVTGLAELETLNVRRLGGICPDLRQLNFTGTTSLRRLSY